MVVSIIRILEQERPKLARHVNMMGNRSSSRYEDIVFMFAVRREYYNDGEFPSDVFNSGLVTRT